MKCGDELLDALLHRDDERQDARPKPKYGYGDAPSPEDVPTAHNTYIPEEQFWNPPLTRKKNEHNRSQ